MNDTEKAILDTLNELEEKVASMAAAKPKPDLLGIFSRLDQLAQQLPATASPELRHYLQKKSYQKARLCLEGKNSETPRGSCS
jgi:hypothetical protein